MKSIKKLLWCLFTWLAFPVVWLIIVPIIMVGEYFLKIPFDMEAQKELFRLMIRDMFLGYL